MLIAHIALRSFGRPEKHPQISWQHCGWARGVFADWSCGLALKVWVPIETPELLLCCKSWLA